MHFSPPPLSRPWLWQEYTKEDFEKTFASRFIIHETVNLKESDRYLYLMQKREDT